MTLQIALIFLIIAGIIVLFFLEVFPMDKIAFCTIGALILFGLISPEESISGFANPAVITILCLMIIAASLEQNGVISWLANGLKRARHLPLLLIVPVFMFIAGSISAFISSTAVVIVFVKIVTELSDKHPISKGKLLLPISFAGILGGSCTLMGTSTNLLVNSIFEERSGMEFEFFEFSWMGVVFLVVAIGMITFLSRFLPEDNSQKLKDQYELDRYLATIELAPDSRLIGKALKDTFLGGENFTLLKVVRSGLESPALDEGTPLEEGDRLLLSCPLPELLKIKTSEEVLIGSEKQDAATVTHREYREEPPAKPSSDQPGRKNPILVEVMMLPGARFLGKTLTELRRVMPQHSIPIAVKRRKNLQFTEDKLYTEEGELNQMKVGDRVLIEIEKDRIADFDQNDNVAILQEYESPDVSKSPKRILTLLILLGVIALAVSGVLEILTSTLLGCVALLLTQCISLEAAYKKIDWQVLILLAGMIPLGIAMHNTGADAWLSNQLQVLMEGQAPFFSLGILFLFTMLLSGFVSNNATAIIMAPLAISLSAGMGLPPKPFVLAVMFAANFSFFTPVGYQTNTLVYSMGIYKFRHFLLIGGCVSLVLWILATFILSTMI